MSKEIQVVRTPKDLEKGIAEGAFIIPKDHKHEWVPHRVGEFDFSYDSPEQVWFIVRFTCGAQDIDCREVYYGYSEASDF